MLSLVQRARGRVTADRTADRFRIGAVSGESEGRQQGRIDETARAFSPEERSIAEHLGELGFDVTALKVGNQRGRDCAQRGLTAFRNGAWSDKLDSVRIILGRGYDDVYWQREES